ncbi:MAG: MATE family efflux transporter [Planctomycetota bacterium]|nr:MATE family efflux transporter [Planctomycetota bacterium]
MTAQRDDSEYAALEASECRESISWITHGSLLAATWRLALPMIGAGLLQNLFSIVDIYFVGRLGPAAISAVTLSGTIVGILLMLGIGITVGCTALVAQAFGAGNRTRAGVVASQSLLVSVILSLVTAAVFPFAPWCLEVLGGTPEVVAEGTSYLQVALIGSFTMFLSITFSAALRGAGDAVTPLKIVGLGNLINIVLDPIFIFGWMGVPAFGVTGSAIATVTARLIATALLAKVFFVDGHEHFHLRLRDLKPQGKIIGQIFGIGVFGSGQMLIRSLSAVAMVRIVAIFGKVPVAGYGIGLRLWMVIMMIGMGFGNAAATLVGQNLGAHRPDRSARAAWLAATMYAVVTLIAGMIFIFFGEQLIALFNSQPGVVSAGSGFLIWVGATFIFIAFSMVLGRAMNGAGDTFWPMLITAYAMLVLRIPLACGLAYAWNSAAGVWVALAASNVLQGGLFVLAFWWGRWKKIGEKHVKATEIYSS